jgi:hypothetical protein
METLNRLQEPRGSTIKNAGLVHTIWGDQMPAAARSDRVCISWTMDTWK